MADPWSLSIAALALLGQTPTFFETWQKFIENWRNKSEVSKQDAIESEISILMSRSDWLLYKIMFLDLITAFSKEHTMSKQVLDFCKSERPQVFEEYNQVNERLRELSDRIDNDQKR